MGWRAMTGEDLDGVSAVSDAVHGDYTEPRATYAERLRLFPAGCHVFDAGRGVEGYLIAHPWQAGPPPPLGGMIGALPRDADRLYLHDLALMPSLRGQGAGAAATRMAMDIAVAGGFRDICLLAVNGADQFWASRGFAPVADPVLEQRLRAEYGDVVFMHRAVGE